MVAIQREKKIEGKATAFKLLSSFAENNRHDITLLREIAYTLNEWNLESKAYELLNQLMRSRPTEPATYNLIANNLIKLGYIDLALIYYDIAFLTDWDTRFDGFDMITAIEYYKLLKKIAADHHKASNNSFVVQRLTDVKKIS